MMQSTTSRLRRLIGRAVACPLLLAAGLVAARVAAGETLTMTASQCAGLSGFRAHWDQPIAVAEDGQRLLKDSVVKDRGQTAVWGGGSRGRWPLTPCIATCSCGFPRRPRRSPRPWRRARRSRRSNWSCRISMRRFGRPARGARITRAPMATATGRTGIATSSTASSGRTGTPSRTCCASPGRPTPPTARPITPPSTARSTGSGSARPTRRRTGSPSGSGRWRSRPTSRPAAWT